MYGQTLRALRGGTATETVAEAVGISVSSLEAYERGERTPRDEVKRRLAAYYGRPEADIFLPQKCTYSAFMGKERPPARREERR